MYVEAAADWMECRRAVRTRQFLDAEVANDRFRKTGGDRGVGSGASADELCGTVTLTGHTDLIGRPFF